MIVRILAKVAIFLAPLIWVNCGKLSSSGFGELPTLDSLAWTRLPMDRDSTYSDFAPIKLGNEWEYNLTFSAPIGSMDTDYGYEKTVVGKQVFQVKSVETMESTTKFTLSVRIEASFPWAQTLNVDTSIECEDDNENVSCANYSIDWKGPVEIFFTNTPFFSVHAVKIKDLLSYKPKNYGRGLIRQWFNEEPHLTLNEYTFPNWAQYNLYTNEFGLVLTHEHDPFIGCASTCDHRAPRSWEFDFLLSRFGGNPVAPSHVL
jgi:hypothetical protein